MHPLPMLIDWAIGVVVEQNLQAFTIMVAVVNLTMMLVVAEKFEKDDEKAEENWDGYENLQLITTPSVVEQRLRKIDNYDCEWVVFSW